MPIEVLDLTQPSADFVVTPPLHERSAPVRLHAPPPTWQDYASLLYDLWNYMAGWSVAFVALVLQAAPVTWQ